MVSLEPRFAVVGLHRCFVCRSHHSVNEQDGHQQWTVEMDEWSPRSAVTDLSTARGFGQFGIAALTGVSSRRLIGHAANRYVS